MSALYRLLLLAAVLLCGANGVRHEPLFDLEGSGSNSNMTGSGNGEDFIMGSGSGSGSGMIVRPEPPTSPVACRGPELTNGEMAMNMSFSGVVLKGKCYSACFDALIRNTEVEQDTSVLWRSVKQSQLAKSCPLYNKVYECQRGCEYRPISGSSCEEDCMDDCRGDSVQLPHSICTRQCNQSLCAIGCNTKTNSHTKESSPWSPPTNSSLSLKKYSSPYHHLPGSYMLSYSVSNRDRGRVHLSGSPYPSLVSYIVESVNSEGESAYYWMTSLTDILTLDHSQICHNLTIRFLPVNRYGYSSDFSPSVSIESYGVENFQLPDHPPIYSISHSISTDIMTGQATVNISWNKPNNYHYASGFLVQISAPSHKHCSSSKTFHVRRDHFNVVWNIMMLVYNVSHTSCNYTMKILSVPYYNRVMKWTPDSVPLHILTNNPVPSDFSYKVSLNVTRSVRTVTFSQYFFFNVTLRLPKNYLLTKDIDRFRVYLWHKNEVDGNSVYMYKVYHIPYQRDTLSYSTHFIIRSQSRGYFVFEVRTLYPDSVPADSRYIKDPSLTSFDARGLPPTVARNVTVTKFIIETDGTFNISMNWLIPEYIYDDNSGQYVIHIGLSERTGSTEDTVNTTLFNINANVIQQRSSILSSFRSYGGGVWNLIMKKELFLYTLLPPTPTWILYVQVLAKNNADRTSNWSTPFILTHSRIHFTINTTTSTPINTTTSTPISTVAVPTLTSSSSSTVSVSRSPSGTPASVTQPVNDWLIPVYGVVAIVLILVLAIGVASVLLLVACVQTRRLGRKPDANSINSFPVVSGAWSEFEEVDSNSINKGVLIGMGTYGPVHRVSVTLGGTGKGKKGKECKDVAMVTLKSSATERDCRSFYTQLDQLKASSSLLKDCTPPPVLLLIGFNITKAPPYLLTELSTHGDLLSYLLDVKSNLEVGGGGIDEVTSTTGVLPYHSDTLNPSDILSFAKQIAAAMDSLSGIGIVHKDLSCRNIFLDSGLTLKLASFGVVPASRGLKRESVYPLDLPLRWMAIESVLDANNFTTASDVWAFGVTLWEIITLGGFPYNGIHDDNILPYLVNGRRLKCPSNCSTELYSILESCWDADPNCRPTFDLLHETLLNQLTQGDCQRLVRVSAREFQMSPTQLSADSALGSSPFPETTSCNDGHKEDKSPSPAPPTLPSAVNLVFRKDSLDPPLAATLQSEGRGSGLPLATDLDAPRVRVSVRPKDSVIEELENGGSTEV